MTNLISGLVRGSKISNGFFGDVFNGTDQIEGPVAIKILRQYLGESDADWLTRRETLLAEGQSLRRARHNKIVNVHHIVRDTNTDNLWLVMELCQSGMQNEYETGPVSCGRVRKIACDVALGLQALHVRGLIHRDIKPGNILIHQSGSAKLGDFGLVTDELVLGYGLRAGYIDHLAPEVWSTHLTSAKTDVWALGMTIYRLLHGAEWYGRLPDKPRTKIRDGGFATSLKWLPHISDRWRRVLKKMMHDDTKQRLPTATAVLTALSSLNCDPDWNCDVATSRITWKRFTAKRSFHVEWTQDPGNNNRWKAWSEPIGDGNKRALGGGVSLSIKDADAQLRKFFET